MDISKHVEKAEEAWRKKNYDYAVGLLHQVLALKPDHGKAWTVLCAATRDRAARKPTPPWLAKIVGSPFLLSSGLARLTKSHASRVRALSKYLKLEPTNPALLTTLGESLAQAGHYEGAVAVFVALGESDKKNGAAWRMAAACHAQIKNVDEALQCLEKALEANPRDAESERMRKNLSADATLRSGAYDQAKSSRELLKDQKQTQALERSQRMQRTAEELTDEAAELGQLLADSPADGRSRRRLAEILIRQKDLSGARELLEAGLDHDDNAADLRDRIGDLRLKELDAEISRLGWELDDEENPDRVENLKGDIADLEGQRRDQGLQEAERRAEEHPTDLALQFALGKALQDQERLDEAIGAYQKAVKDPKCRIEALTRLGGCFQVKGHFDLAEKQFTAALEETSAVSDQGKGILYNLGLIAEQAGRKDDALAWFTRIYEIDIQYKDVSQRVETLRS